MRAFSPPQIIINNFVWQEMQRDANIVVERMAVKTDFGFEGAACLVNLTLFTKQAFFFFVSL